MQLGIINIQAFLLRKKPVRLLQQYECYPAGAAAPQRSEGLRLDAGDIIAYVRQRIPIVFKNFVLCAFINTNKDVINLSCVSICGVVVNKPLSI